VRPHRRGALPSLCAPGSGDLSHGAGLIVASRSIGELTFQDVSRQLRPTSILCLPLGSMEQHGPHLPLNTDTVIAEGITTRIVARWGERYDLWQLPALGLGLSREHEWAAGT